MFPPPTVYVYFPNHHSYFSASQCSAVKQKRRAARSAIMLTTGMYGKIFELDIESKKLTILAEGGFEVIASTPDGTVFAVNKDNLVRLRSDGGAADDRVVLDYQRRQPGTAEFALEGYSHGIAYNARALHSLGRYYDSVTAEAIDDSAETLAVSSTGITIWSNLLDGNANASVALSD